jgi:hypothetical protein
MSKAAELAADLDDDVYVRIESDLVIIGDSVMTDRYHTVGENMEQYDASNPQNEIGGIIPPFSLSGWLRHGMEALVQERGGTACHPGEANANFMKDDVYERDLDSGYHPKGDCLPRSDADAAEGCVVLDLFGGFERMPGKFMRRPIQFAPNRSSIDYERGQAEGHYREINRNVVSRNEADAREPLRNTTYDAVANLDGCWHLSFRERKPEFLALLHDGVAYLDDHNTDFMHQLGGARNFGGGIVDTRLINPLYDESELKRLFKRNKGKTDADRKTQAMEQKDERWREEYLPAFREQLTDRIGDH